MTKEDMLEALLRGLLEEGWADSRTAIPEDAASKRHLLRMLMNIRPPLPARPELIRLQDRLLTEEPASLGVISPYELPTIGEAFGDAGVPFQNQLILWKGDITTLPADAIVNAANSKLLGCFVPHHHCIDNAIHSAAGIQLRLECHAIMNKQGHDEPTGQAKITHGYNLPARYVLHTVGPIIYDSVTERDERLLASCYKACLDTAAERHDIKTVAFCSISTGEYRFPKLLAAKTAKRAVCDWLADPARRLDRIIFNVFTQENYDAYAAVFRTG
jgi:O-acetyl-ADP-ribose deacetylase (regulator of RNase III)